MTPRRRMLVIAHRGVSEHHPENTLQAFEAAIAAGADMIELDITLTSDGKFVVIHDDTLWRTTNGDGFVSHQSTRDIEALDAGSWFGGRARRNWVPGLDRVLKAVEQEVPAAAKVLNLVQKEVPGADLVLGQRHSGIHVPTLDQALECIGPHAEINIEVKPFFPLNQAGRMQAALARLLTQLEERGLTSRIILSSTNFFLLEYARELSEDIRLGIIYRKPLTDFDPIFVAKAYRAYSVHPWERQVTVGFVKALHGAGLKVFPYTVNTAKRLMELNELGVDGVFTDDPAATRQALDAHIAKSTAAP